MLPQRQELILWIFVGLLVNLMLLEDGDVSSVFDYHSEDIEFIEPGESVSHFVQTGPKQMKRHERKRVPLNRYQQFHSTQQRTHNNHW